ncbi:MAG: PorT family protein [Prevotellaceae bacterium]|nr:PorT family protein [Prevotellaceae bacterium]
MKSIYRKAFLLVLVISTTAIVEGQETTEKTYLINNYAFSGPTTYRIEAGYANSQRFPKNTSGTYGIQGVYLGVTTAFDLLYKIKLQAGLIYHVYQYDRTQKYKNNVVAKYKTLPGHRLDIPIQAKYEFNMGGSFKLSLYAGPVLNIGISNKEDIFVAKGSLTDEEFERYNTLIGLPESGIYEQYGKDYRRFGLTLDGGAAIQWRNYIAKGGYRYQLTDLYKPKGKKLHEGGWYAGLAFEF